ncbi:tetratricopeptide repeat protein [Parvibium lacunae]|uniref:Tetratricopeptide repeat protein n=2 Tax=Parvibium lacunae TaxID=1888893 RepID=A0A368L6Z2_9BURK|nr:tetratricopeptide repeat protein [Parvibium lacunae]
MAAPVYADEAQEVTRLLRAGQLDQAMSRADTFLASKPRDAQMRFLKGLILTEQSKTQDAVQVFLRLTEDYPELPEPYNNLAVLYAAQGQFDKARAALEMAIRTHPSYATAHENLGDVYSKLASQAYDKALQLDANNTTAQTKLALIRDLVGGGKTRPPATVAANNRPAATSPIQPAPAPAAPVSGPKPAIEPPKPQVVTDTAPNKSTPVAPAPAAASKVNDSEEIGSTVQSWAKAWSRQDTKSYLAFYGKDFDTPKGMSRSAWEQERRQRIEGKNKIEVQVEQLQIQQNGDKAVAKFRQNYKSDRLSTSSRKTLELQKSNGKWVIVEERSGN